MLLILLFDGERYRQPVLLLLLQTRHGPLDWIALFSADRGSFVQRCCVLKEVSQ
jgi:hypothetical protein